jgi:hypothetical protein
MEIKNKSIHGGNAFDWGRTSSDYAKYRDIYPPMFYEDEYEERGKRSTKSCLQKSLQKNLRSGTLRPCWN